MLHDLPSALVITRRELRDQMRDWRIIFPVLFLAFVFPFIMNFTADQIVGMLRSYGVGILADSMVPFLLMIVGFFPISVSLALALESFVGEKERGTIEPLLNSPLKDGQLYLGKLIAAACAPVVGGCLGMTVYLLGCVWRGIPLPAGEMIAQIYLLTVVQAVMMVSAAIVVSTQATSVRSANLLASFIVIPMALLVQGESMVIFWGKSTTLWWALFGVLTLTVLLVRVGLAHFRREELLNRDLDSLNLRELWRVFYQYFRGGATSAWDWYLHEVASTLRGLGIPTLLVTLLAVAAVIIGVRLMQTMDAPQFQQTLMSENSKLQDLANQWPLFDYHPVVSIWWQNVRAMLIALALGAVSFGILGTLPIMLTLVLAGYVSASVVATGIPAGSYLIGFILPHGIIEIPAAILATAAILKGGAALASGSGGRSLGEQCMISLADFARVMLGLVVPLLLIGASIEAWVTPRVALMVFGG